MCVGGGGAFECDFTKNVLIVSISSIILSNGKL